MKLAFISLMEGVPGGGSEALWKKTAHLALEQGHGVNISVVDWGAENNVQFRSLADKGAKLHFRKKYRPHLPPLKKLWNYFETHIARPNANWLFLLKEKPAHVLISQGGSFDLVQHHRDLLSILQRHGITYSLVCHSHPQFAYIPDETVRKHAPEMFLKARHVFFISSTQQRLVERVIMQPLPHASFTWNPLNLKSPECLEWPPNEVPQFAMVGGLVSGKGHDLAMAILSKEAWTKRTWHLNIYGDGYGSAYLKRLAGTDRLSERISFHGQVKGAEEIWAKNHILLVPSSGEGLPIAIVEAMVSGRPVVATDVGGIAELVKEKTNGFISAGPTASSFGAAMERAWESRRTWEKIGAANHHEILERIDLQPERKVLEAMTK